MAIRSINLLILLVHLVLIPAGSARAQDSLQELLGSDCSHARERLSESKDIIDLFARVLTLNPNDLANQPAGLGLIVAFDDSSQLNARRCILNIVAEQPDLSRKLMVPLLKFVNNHSTTAELRLLAKNIVLESIERSGKDLSEDESRKILQETGQNDFGELVLHALIRFSPAAPAVLLAEDRLTEELSFSFEEAPDSLMSLELKSDQLPSVLKIITRVKFGAEVIIKRAISVCDERRFISKTLLNTVFQESFLQPLSKQLDSSGKHQEFLECLEKSSSTTSSMIDNLIRINRKFKDRVVDRASLSCNKFSFFYLVVEELKDTAIDQCIKDGLDSDPGVIEVLVKRNRWSSRLAAIFSDLVTNNNLTADQRLLVLKAAIHAVPFMSVRAIAFHLPALLNTKVSHTVWEDLLPLLRKYKSKVNEIITGNGDKPGIGSLLAVMIGDGLYPIKEMGAFDDKDKLYLLKNLPEPSLTDGILQQLTSINYNAFGCEELLPEAYIERLCRRDCAAYLGRIGTCRSGGGLPVTKIARLVSPEQLSHYVKSQGVPFWESLVDDDIRFLLEEGFLPKEASLPLALKIFKFLPPDKAGSFVSILSEPLKENCGYWLQPELNHEKLQSAFVNCPADQLIRERLNGLPPAERDDLIRIAIMGADEHAFMILWEIFGKTDCAKIRQFVIEKAGSLGEDAKFMTLVTAVQCPSNEAEAKEYLQNYIHNRKVSAVLPRILAASAEVREKIVTLLKKISSIEGNRSVSFTADTLDRGIVPGQ